MARSITQFMWGHQEYVRASAFAVADALFTRCDPALRPDVFLVGFLNAPRADRLPVCISPERNLLLGDETLAPAFFNDLLASSTEHILTQDVRPALERNEQSLAESVKARLDDASRHLDVVHFCTSPIQVDCYRVVLVLRLCRSAYESHYALRRRERGGVMFQVSLLRAAVEVYLRESARQLKGADGGKAAIQAQRPADELLREAGRQLCESAGYAAGGVDGAWGLFDACNAISAMQYEGAEAVGGIIVAAKEHPDIELTVEFKSSIAVQDHRTVRKMLESSDRVVRLVLDAGRIVGLGRVPDGRYTGSAENLFTVRFSKHFCWDLHHAGHHMMHVAYGCPEMPRPDRHEDRFREVFSRVFADSPSSDVDRVWAVVDAACLQNRGSTIVIVDRADEEASRLSGQSIGVQPIPCVPGLVPLLSAVDGAIVLDPTCMCHAFGTILDGKAVPGGDRSRGSRFNSALRYQEGCSVASADAPARRCVIVVVSEDGMINVLPDLRPRIHRDEIEQRLVDLETVAANADAGDDEYAAAHDRLRRYEFYLDTGQCERANTAHHVYARRAAPPARTVDRFDLFARNEKLDESYFFS